MNQEFKTHNFKKKYGQNFLKSQAVINQIVKAIPKNTEDVIEIGPGAGALSEKLSQKNYKIEALEIDEDCIKILEEKQIKNLKITKGDALTYKFEEKGVIGNLPYNISTKILINFCYKTIPWGIFMLQKEVAEKILSTKCERLSMMIKSRYSIKKVTNAKAADFHPKPKVDSQVIKIEEHDKYKEIEFKKIEEVGRIVFQNKRKKISSTKKINEAVYEAIVKCEIDLNKRPEDLSEEEFFNICKAYEKKQQ